MFSSTNFLKVLHYSEFSNAWLLKVVFFRFSFGDVGAVTLILMKYSHGYVS